MKRLFVLLVALLLPLQLAWGLAATYCQHETTAEGARHFGHHTHVHTEAKPDAGNKAAAGKLVADFDCGFCHASPAAALPAFEALPEAPATAAPPLALGELRPPSAPQRAPDRPQWPRLA